MASGFPPVAERDPWFKCQLDLIGHNAACNYTPNLLLWQVFAVAPVSNLRV